MADDRVSAKLKEFLQQHFHSVEEVEVLILLGKTRDREWTAAALSQAMTSSLASIEKRLADLYANGLVSRREDRELRYRYGPKTSALEIRVEELIQIYPELRMRIVQTIFEAPIDRIKNIADAFRLKEDKDHG